MWASKRIGGKGTQREGAIDSKQKGAKGHKEKEGGKQTMHTKQTTQEHEKACNLGKG